jgi:hypothetical protein
MAMDKNGNGTSTLPDTLGTIPGALTRLGASPSVESRGQVARKEIPALFQEGAEAEAKSKMDAFDRDQGVLRKTADAERDVARGTRMAGQKLETGLQKRGVFEAPQYTASDYAKNSATRMITAVLLGGIAKTSAMGQLKAIESMQKAEQQGLADQFDAARLQFDEQEKQRQDNNKMLKDRFDRMIDLLSKDRNAALVEAKLIEGQLGKGIIATKLKAGLFYDAYNLAQKTFESDNRIALEKTKSAGKATGGRAGQYALTYASRVYGNIENAAQDLENIQNLPEVAQSPVLSGLINRDPETTFGSITALVGRKITNKEARAFDQVANSLSAALARLEAQGLASGGTKGNIAAFDAVKPRAGDDAINMALYIARVKQEIEVGIRVHDKMPGATPEQKAEAQRILEELNRIVPFNTTDVMETLRKNRVQMSDKMNTLVNRPTVVEQIKPEVVERGGKRYELNPETGNYREVPSGRP